MSTDAKRVQGVDTSARSRPAGARYSTAVSRRVAVHHLADVSAR
jgi:hypothetical protein